MVSRKSYGDKHDRKVKMRDLIERLEDNGFKVTSDRTRNNRISEYTLSTNGKTKFLLMVQMLIIHHNGKQAFHAILFKKNEPGKLGKQFEQVRAYENQVSIAMFADQLKRDALTEML